MANKLVQGQAQLAYRERNMDVLDNSRAKLQSDDSFHQCSSGNSDQAVFDFLHNNHPLIRNAVAAHTRGVVLDTHRPRSLDSLDWQNNAHNKINYESSSLKSPPRCQDSNLTDRSADSGVTADRSFTSDHVGGHIYCGDVISDVMMSSSSSLSTSNNTLSEESGEYRLDSSSELLLLGDEDGGGGEVTPPSGGSGELRDIPEEDAGSSRSCSSSVDSQRALEEGGQYGDIAAESDAQSLGEEMGQEVTSCDVITLVLSSKHNVMDSPLSPSADSDSKDTAECENRLKQQSLALRGAGAQPNLLLAGIDREGGAGEEEVAGVNMESSSSDDDGFLIEWGPSFTDRPAGEVDAGSNPAQNTANLPAPKRVVQCIQADVHCSPDSDEYHTKVDNILEEAGTPTTPTTPGGSDASPEIGSSIPGVTFKPRIQGRRAQRQAVETARQAAPSTPLQQPAPSPILKTGSTSESYCLIESNDSLVTKYRKKEKVDSLSGSGLGVRRLRLRSKNKAFRRSFSEHDVSEREEVTSIRTRSRDYLYEGWKFGAGSRGVGAAEGECDRLELVTYQAEPRMRLASLQNLDPAGGEQKNQGDKLTNKIEQKAPKNAQLDKTNSIVSAMPDGASKETPVEISAERCVDFSYQHKPSANQGSQGPFTDPQGSFIDPQRPAIIPQNAGQSGDDSVDMSGAKEQTPTMNSDDRDVSNLPSVTHNGLDGVEGAVNTVQRHTDGQYTVTENEVVWHVTMDNPTQNLDFVRKPSSSNSESYTDNVEHRVPLSTEYRDLRLNEQNPPLRWNNCVVFEGTSISHPFRANEPIEGYIQVGIHSNRTAALATTVTTLETRDVSPVARYYAVTGISHAANQGLTNSETDILEQLRSQGLVSEGKTAPEKESESERNVVALETNKSEPGDEHKTRDMSHGLEYINGASSNESSSDEDRCQKRNIQHNDDEFQDGDDEFQPDDDDECRRVDDDFRHGEALRLYDSEADEHFLSHDAHAQYSKPLRWSRQSADLDGSLSDLLEERSSVIADTQHRSRDDLFIDEEESNPEPQDECQDSNLEPRNGSLDSNIEYSNQSKDANLILQSQNDEDFDSNQEPSRAVIFKLTGRSEEELDQMYTSQIGSMVTEPFKAVGKSDKTGEEMSQDSVRDYVRQEITNRTAKAFGLKVKPAQTSQLKESESRDQQTVSVRTQYECLDRTRDLVMSRSECDEFSAALDDILDTETKSEPTESEADIVLNDRSYQSQTDTDTCRKQQGGQFTTTIDQDQQDKTYKQTVQSQENTQHVVFKQTVIRNVSYDEQIAESVENALLCAEHECVNNYDDTLVSKKQISDNFAVYSRKTENVDSEPIYAKPVKTKVAKYETQFLDRSKTDHPNPNGDIGNNTSYRFDGNETIEKPKTNNETSVVGSKGHVTAFTSHTASINHVTQTPADHVTKYSIDHVTKLPTDHLTSPTEHLTSPADHVTTSPTDNVTKTQTDHVTKTPSIEPNNNESLTLQQVLTRRQQSRYENASCSNPATAEVADHEVYLQTLEESLSFLLSTCSDYSATSGDLSITSGTQSSISGERSPALASRHKSESSVSATQYSTADSRRPRAQSSSTQQSNPRSSSSSRFHEDRSQSEDKVLSGPPVVPASPSRAPGAQYAMFAHSTSQDQLWGSEQTNSTQRYYGNGYQTLPHRRPAAGIAGVYAYPEPSPLGHQANSPAVFTNTATLGSYAEILRKRSDSSDPSLTPRDLSLTRELSQSGDSEGSMHRFRMLSRYDLTENCSPRTLQRMRSALGRPVPAHEAASMTRDFKVPALTAVTGPGGRSDGSGAELGHTTPRFVRDTSRLWYKPHISRDEAIALIRDRPPGWFVIRDSNSFPGAYGLALKVNQVPPNVNAKGEGECELVRHFLIESTSKGVKIKGCSNEPVFGTLAALVYQHTITPLALPCKVLLPEPSQGGDSVDGGVELHPTRSQLLQQGAACNVLYLNTVNMETLTGPEAVSKAVRSTLAQSPLPPTTVVHFKVSSDGITLTDNKHKLFFRRHYAVSHVTFCGLDPEDRKWPKSSDDSKMPTNARLFGFVARKAGGSLENQCHVFAEYDPQQPASAIVNFVTKVMIGQGRSGSRS